MSPTFVMATALLVTPSGMAIGDAAGWSVGTGATCAMQDLVKA
jgi:hypothetical protein